MKKLILMIVVLALAASTYGQENSKDKNYGKLPSVDVKNLDGETFNTADLMNDGKPIILSFWATYCKPCLKELNNIAEVYEEWQEDTGVKVVAVSIDKADRIGSVKNKVYAGNWGFDVFLDENSDLKRAMNVNNVPHTFILDGEGNIVWQHTSYADGGEFEYLEIVTKLNNGEAL
ncbi:TlpA family protein disulfide reductase [Bacteroidota bacterium]